jgi:accessory gene regulator B
MDMENKLKNRVDYIDLFAECLTSRVNTYLNKEGLELEKMKLGFQILIINISKFIILFAVAEVLGLVKETILMIIVFGCLRKCTFGLHAKSSLVCTITCIAMFNIGSYISQFVKINNYIVFIAFTIINILLYKYAPADTECHPLLGAKLRAKLKKEAVLTGIGLMVLALIIPIPIIKTLMMLSAIYAVIIILPITYKILKRGYDKSEK